LLARRRHREHDLGAARRLRCAAEAVQGAMIGASLLPSSPCVHPVPCFTCCPVPASTCPALVCLAFVSPSGVGCWSWGRRVYTSDHWDQGHNRFGRYLRGKYVRRLRIDFLIASCATARQGQGRRFWELRTGTFLRGCFAQQPS
jgi:hypothetical protein